MSSQTEILDAALPGDSAGTAAWAWVAVRTLGAQHRSLMLAHLTALGDLDRSLRFGQLATDEQIRAYVDRIDFARDQVFGIFNRRLQLIAQAHLAAMPGSRQAEFGVSVLPHARGRGFGSRLFDHAVLHARNRSVDTLLVYALADNTPMLRIARGAGATVERDGGEALAKLRLPPDDMRSRLDEFVGDNAAELDYRLKVQAQRVSNVIDAIGDIKRQMAGTAKATE